VHVTPAGLPPNLSSHCYAVRTRPGNRTLREPFVIAIIGFCIASSGTRLRPPLWACAGVLAAFSNSVGRINPAAVCANSARVSTPNLLNNEDTWNFTVRTVLFSRDAVSSFARWLTPRPARLFVGRSRTWGKRRARLLQQFLGPRYQPRHQGLEPSLIRAGQRQEDYPRTHRSPFRGVSSGQTQIVQKADTILAKLNELQEKGSQSPPPTPKEVSSQISDLRKSLFPKANEAEAAYEKGYELLSGYRFRDEIPDLGKRRQFRCRASYSALGQAYEALPGLSPAQAALQTRLSLVTAKRDDRYEALFRN